MPPRKKPDPAKPLRRSERLRLRKEAAEAAEAARVAELAEQEPEELAEPPRRRRGRKSRATNRVPTSGRVTRRGRRSRRNVAVTTSPFDDEAMRREMFGSFMNGIFQAARESYNGGLSERPTANPNPDEQPTQDQGGQLSGQELDAEEGMITEEMSILILMHSSDSEMEGL